MVSPFEAIAQRLGDLGFYNFLLPWLITSALIWGLLKRAKLFGDDAVVINSVLSISVSFFIWGFIIFTGGEVGGPLSSFLSQMIFIGIAFLLIVLVGNLLVPGFNEKITEALPTSSVLWIVLTIVVIVLLGTGLINIGRIFYDLIATAGNVPGGDVGILIIAVLFLVVILIMIAGA
jgi:hypothetical protein